MIHGTEKTTFEVGESTLSDIKKYNGVYGDKAIRSYRIKIKVLDTQQEMAEYLAFSKELSSLRKDNKLTVDKDDTTTYPAFIIQYPKIDVDGSYFIVKCYTVFLDN